jgi:hypothetical protein
VIEVAEALEVGDAATAHQTHANHPIPPAHARTSSRRIVPQPTATGTARPREKLLDP